MTRIPIYAARTLAICVLLAIPLDGLQAQITRRIGDAAKQALEDQQTETEDHLVDQAGFIVDSAASTAMSPVDSLIADAASGVQAGIELVAGALSSGESLDGQIAAGLDAGRLDVVGVFETGTTFFTLEGAEIVSALGRALAERGGAWLLEGRSTWDESPDLGEERAAAVKDELSLSGVPTETVFATGGSEAVVREDGSAVTLTVRALH